MYCQVGQFIVVYSVQIIFYLSVNAKHKFRYETNALKNALVHLNLNYLQKVLAGFWGFGDTD